MNTLLSARSRLLGIVGAILLLTTPALANEPKPEAPQPGARLVKPVPEEATKLHVVLLVYGHKGGISAACQKDCNALKAILETAFEDEEERLDIHELNNKNPATNKPYNATETLAAIKKLKVGSNDNVVIFQSGHGAIGNMDDPEMTHRLSMDSATLTRAQIQKPVLAMSPRGLIFLTDCCSAGKKKAQPQPKAEPVSHADLNVDTVRNLFLRPYGVVSITAAEDGTLAQAAYAGANPAKAGSAFTVAMMRLWYDDTTYENWNDFFPALRKETLAASRNRHAARAFHLSDGSPMSPPICIAR